MQPEPSAAPVAADGGSGAGAVDWGASPWVGPRVETGEGPPAEATATARPARSRRAEPVGGAGQAAAAERGARRRGRDRDRERERVEPPLPSTRRRAAGSVGRRTVSSRPARDLTPDDDALEVARQVCLDQLSYTARTRAELATALDHRGVPAEVAEQVLTRFTEVGLVDDEAFAASWVARRSAGKGLARRALTQELRQRGVADSTAQAALDALDPEDELAHARALVERKLVSTASVAPEARVRRLVAMLARKGYGAGLAFQVVREALAAEGVALDDDRGGEPG
ncbi:MAG: regulatory protein RecX [Frankiales bacterium]|nr:regulatory protein RecX [Frankiales bacterium]